MTRAKSRSAKPSPARAPRAGGRTPRRGAKSAEPAPRAWQRMLSGRRLDLLDPSPMDVEIEDIAHGLARVARWNGQTEGDHAFSVAQHCLLVEEILGRLDPQIEAKWRLAALLHDAPEYVIGDMISPFKAALGVDYKDFEERLERAVHLRFGLPAITPKGVKARIKEADIACAFFEATQIAGFSVVEAETFFGAPPAKLEIEIAPQPVARAQAAFLKRFDALHRDVHGAAPKSAARARVP